MASFFDNKVLTPVKRVFSTSWLSGIPTVPPEMNRKQTFKVACSSRGYSRQPPA